MRDRARAERVAKPPVPEPTVGSSKPLLASLTGLRGVAAAWVVIEHYRQPISVLAPGMQLVSKLINSGYLGVEIFFVLSGFIIAYNYVDKFVVVNRRTYRRFIEARLARIYPVHVAMLMVVLVLVLAARVTAVHLNSTDNYGVSTFLGNLLMLQAFDAVGPWNSPSWSITCEFAAYLFFPLLAMGLVKIARARTAFGAALILAGCGSALLAMYLTGDQHGPTSGVAPWARIAIEFPVGCLLYIGWVRLGRPRGGCWDAAAAIIAITVIAIIALVPDSPSWQILVIPLLSLFVLACAGVDGIVGWVLGNAVSQWLGRVSYSLYMVHFIVLNVAGKVLRWDRFATSGGAVRFCVLAAYFAIAIATAALLYRFVERPSRSRLLAICSRREARRIKLNT